MAATFTAQRNSASHGDAATCTLAIEHGHLSLQDLRATFVNRGNLYFLSAVFDKAIEEYTLALNLGLTKDHVAHYNRGLAYEKVGDLAKASADYRRTIELKPEWSQPQAKLDRLQHQAKTPAPAQ